MCDIQTEHKERERNEKVVPQVHDGDNEMENTHRVFSRQSATHCTRLIPCGRDECLSRNIRLK